MARYKELTSNVVTPTVLVNAVATVNLNDIGSADTFTLTFTRVGSATATTTGTITFDASTTTLAANIQTAVRALSGYDTSTVTWDSAQIYRVTTSGASATTGFSGTDVDITITGATGFTPGAVTQITEGSAAVTTYFHVGGFVVPKRIRIAGFNDNSLDIALVDANARTVYSRTAVDTNSSGTDAPVDVYITADGRAGEDGAAAANVTSGVFEGPLKLTVTTSGDLLARNQGRVVLFVEKAGESRFRVRRTGAVTGSSARVGLGAQVAKIRAIKLTASADTSVAVAVADAYGKNVYTQASADHTAGTFAQLSHEGQDQAGNAVADLCDIVAKGPLTVTLTGLGSGTFRAEFWVED